MLKLSIFPGKNSQRTSRHLLPRKEGM